MSSDKEVALDHHIDRIENALHEARSEIARHHELIATMRRYMERSCVLLDASYTDCKHAAEMRLFLNTEVS